jgi:hypothetical protein
MQLLLISHLPNEMKGLHPEIANERIINFNQNVSDQNSVFNAICMEILTESIPLDTQNVEIFLVKILS